MLGLEGFWVYVLGGSGGGVTKKSMVLFQQP